MSLLNLSRRFIGATALASLAWAAQAMPVLQTTDFIVAPANFNGFENIPNDGTFYTGGAGPYTEDGISVRQINGDPPNDIWVTIAQSVGLETEGLYAWYPNGGDNGYTSISLSTMANMDSISLIFRSYGGNVAYDLLDDGNSVLSGTLTFASFDLGRIGFSGGGFDTVLLRGGALGNGVDNGAFQALHIDSIKVNDRGQIPEPATAALVGLSLLGLAATRRRRSKESAMLRDRL